MALADTDLQAAPTVYFLANLHIITETRMSMTGTTACQYTIDEPAPIVTDLCNINFMRFKILTMVTIKVCPQFSGASHCPVR